MRDEDHVAKLVGFLARQQMALAKNRAKGGWDGMEAQDLMALVLSEVAEIADGMRTGRTVEEVLAEIGDAVACLGMLADVIQRRGRYTTELEEDARRVAMWLMENGQASDRPLWEALQLLQTKPEAH
jgi:NTP pyrophosphatase (non-canonical NTP hydrolase)